MRLFPEAFQIFILRSLAELGGILLVCAGGFILISIFSNSSHDDYLLGTIDIKNIFNLGGVVGANLSNVLLQLFGYSSALIALVFISWSFKLIKDKKLSFFAVNLFLLPFFLISIDTVFALTQLITINGFLSTQIIIFLKDLDFISETSLHYSFLAISLVLSFVFLYFCMGLNLNEWKHIFNFIIKIFTKTFGFLSLSIKSVTSKKTSKEAKISQSEKSELEQKIEPKIDFENLRSTPVQEFNKTSNDSPLIQQSEIDLDDSNSYNFPEEFRFYLSNKYTLQLINS